MKTLVMYGSHYGTTKRYAQTIASKLNTTAISYEKVTKDKIEQAELIIYGGGVYAGSLVGHKIFKTYETLLSQKELMVFTCGSTNTEDEKNCEALHGYVASALGKALCSQAHIFYVRGDLNYEKMNFKHKLMMKGMIAMLKKKKEKTEDEQMVIDTYGGVVSFYDEAYIVPILACVEELNKAYENKK